jgi:4-carboxymuconolactone decarboxylase
MLSHASSPTSGDLNSRRKYAVLISASLVAYQENRLRQDFLNALHDAFTYSELIEIILQSLLFDGYPCALEGLILLKSMESGKLPADEKTELYTYESVTTWRQRGEELCHRIYGSNYEKLLQNVAALSPTLKEWMLYEGYGRVLARPALSIDLRELGIIAILSVKGLPRQLHSHLRGALRVGVSREELEIAIHHCAEYTTPENIESALNILTQIS